MLMCEIWASGGEGGGILGIFGGAVLPGLHCSFRLIYTNFQTHFHPSLLDTWSFSDPILVDLSASEAMYHPLFYQRILLVTFLYLFFAKR